LKLWVHVEGTQTKLRLRTSWKEAEVISLINPDVALLLEMSSVFEIMGLAKAEKL
jgi:hypothetical protein